MDKIDTVFLIEKHPLWGHTYLYGPHKWAPPRAVESSRNDMS